jgi:hypothetical protein
MSEEETLSKKDQLALALAKGISIQAWARKNEVPRTTVYRWAAEPEVRKAMELHRRRLIDRAVGRMTDRYTWATDQIAALGRGAESESVRLSALRSILSDMMAVSRYSGFEERLTDMETRLDERDREASSMRYPAAKYDSGAATSTTPPAPSRGNGAV